MRVNPLTVLVPEWAMFWLAVAAVCALVLNARALAITLGAIPAFHWLLAPLLEPFIAAMPLWALCTGLLVFAAILLHAAIAFAFGDETASRVTSSLIVRSLEFIFVAPLRALRALWDAARGLRRR